MNGGGHLSEVPSSKRDTIDVPTESTEAPVGNSIAIGPQEDDNLNQGGGESSEDDAESDVDLANNQLASIPPQPAPAADGSSTFAAERIPNIRHVNRNSLPSEFLTLADFLSCLPIGARLEFYLSIKDIINLGRSNSALKAVVDDFVLHYIVANTYIKFWTKYERADGRQRREWLMLYPVIKRIPVQDRNLPEKRVVYEPCYDETRHAYRLNEIAPDEIEFFLPERLELNPYCWPLGERQVRRPRRTRHISYREECNAPPSNFSIVQEVFYKFENGSMSIGDQRSDFPVNVFYKRDHDTETLKLHAVSIPLQCLLERLFADSPRRPNRSNCGRNNGRHSQ